MCTNYDDELKTRVVPLQVLSSVFLESFRWKVISAVINLDIDADAKDAVLRELIKINKEPQTTRKEPAK